MGKRRGDRHEILAGATVTALLACTPAALVPPDLRRHLTRRIEPRRTGAPSQHGAEASAGRQPPRLSGEHAVGKVKGLDTR